MQLLKARGARVIGIATDANHPWLESLGVVLLDYSSPMLAERILSVAPLGVDCLIDTHGAEYLELGLELGIAPEHIETVAASEFAGLIGAKTDGALMAASGAVWQEMVDLVAEGVIAVQAASYPLREVQHAHVELDERHTGGKIVLIPPAGPTAWMPVCDR